MLCILFDHTQNSVLIRDVHGNGTKIVGIRMGTGNNIGLHGNENYFYCISISVNSR